MPSKKYNISDFEVVEEPSQELAFNSADFDIVDDEPLEAQADDESDVLEEMHPSFSWADRAKVKNFGNSIDASIAYLQKQYPDLEIGQDSGEIIARAPGEDKYRKLDPSSWGSMLNPVEFLQDVTDVGYDVASGVGTAAATTGAGLAGSAAGGVGAIPAAMAGGAAASAGGEALRQWLGEKLGVNQEMNMGDVAMSGAFGAASPLLLGTGASVGQAAKQALKEGGKRTAQEILGTQKGVLARAAPHVGSTISGRMPESIKTAYNRMGEIDALDEGKMKDYARETTKLAADAIKKAKNSVGKEIGDVVKNLDGEVDIITARAPIEMLQAELADEAENMGSAASREALDELNDLLGKYFTKTSTVVEEVGTDPGLAAYGLSGGGELVEKKVKEPIQQLRPKDAWSLVKQLEHYGEKYKTSAAPGSRHAGSTSVSDQRIMNAAVEAASNIRNQLDDAAGGRLTDLNASYHDISNLEKEARQILRDPRATYRNMSSIFGSGARVQLETLGEVDDIAKTNLLDRARLLTAHKDFSKAPWLAVSSNGTTSTSRTVPLSDAFGAAGQYAGASSGLGQGMAAVGRFFGNVAGATVGSPAALRAYMSTARNMSKLDDQFRNLTGNKIPVTRAAIYSGWNGMGER